MGSQKKEWLVYLLECSDKSLYCGVTNNIQTRLEKHNCGTASKYTRSRRPVSCVAKSPLLTKKEAFQLEYQTKRLSKKDKINFVSNAGRTNNKGR
ncbi:MAG: GIY-YIG nuclease family protein [Desulfobacterales bacterium]|nr:GIY-YIG nuclease family protein [Desulfobacterales bacterium]